MDDELETLWMGLVILVLSIVPAPARMGGGGSVRGPVEVGTGHVQNTTQSVILLEMIRSVLYVMHLKR